MHRVEKLVSQLHRLDETKDGDEIKLQPNPCENDFSKSINKSKFQFTIDEFADKILTTQQREFYEKKMVT